MEDELGGREDVKKHTKTVEVPGPPLAPPRGGGGKLDRWGLQNLSQRSTGEGEGAKKRAIFQYFC